MKSLCLLLAGLGLLLPARAAEVLHYNLLPGSTITPYFGAEPTGPTEALSGHLDWLALQAPVPDLILAYNAVDLSFESASFRLVLNRDPVNDVASSVHADSSYTVMNEVADLTGFDIPAGYLLSVSPGTYYGPATRPVVLRYPNVGLGPVPSGVWRARLNIVAAMDGITVNLAPSFAKGPDVAVAESSGPQTVPGWATEISPGGPGEAGQVLTFLVTTDHGALFSVPPAIAADGTLTFTPAPGETGTAQVTVVLKDDGGTAYGGQDTSSPQTFVIEVEAVNVAPSFVRGPDLVVLQNSGPQVVPGWATQISPGPASEAGQTVTFIVSTDNGRLFSRPPTITPDGTLGFTAASGRSGVALVTVVLKDHGGTANGGQDTSAPQTFRIAVLSPSQAVEELAREVREAPLEHFNKRLLLASLEAAAESFERGHVTAGINQLQAFQHKVQAQLARTNPALAQHWVAQAQDIINIFAHPLRPAEPPRRQR